MPVAAKGAIEVGLAGMSAWYLPPLDLHPESPRVAVEQDRAFAFPLQD
jgi:hypothetical protein